MSDDDPPFAIIGRPSIRGMESALRWVAEAEDNPAFLRAARALYQQSGGRPAADDDKLIAEAQWLVSCGKAPSLNAALRRVVRTLPAAANQKSAVERLRRKIASSVKKGSTK